MGFRLIGAPSSGGSTPVPTMPNLTFSPTNFGLGNPTAAVHTTGAANAYGTATALGTTTAAINGFFLSLGGGGRPYKVNILADGVIVGADYPVNAQGLGSTRPIWLNIPSGKAVSVQAATNSATQSMTFNLVAFQSDVDPAISSIVPVPGSSVNVSNGMGAVIAATNPDIWVPLGTALTSVSKGIATIHAHSGNDGSRLDSGLVTYDIATYTGADPNAGGAATVMLSNLSCWSSANAIHQSDLGPFFRTIAIGTQFAIRARHKADGLLPDAFNVQLAIMY